MSKQSKTIRTAAFALATLSLAAFQVGCSTDEGEDEPGTIVFKIAGEDITYDSLTGEDGYNHVKYATIDYAYMIVKTPKLEADHPVAKAGAPLAKRAHTGIPLTGMYAVDLMDTVELGQVENVEAGDYSFPPSINLYNPTADERANVVDKGGALAKIPQGYSFRFGGIIMEKDGVTSHRYEIRENFTGKVTIDEYPPEAGDGTPLVLKSGGTLELHFHPHIDHALEVICHDNPLDFDTLEKSGDTLVFSPTMNSEYYEDIVAHINRGDHWDVNVIPE
jgi:hypothetical protein